MPIRKLFLVGQPAIELFEELGYEPRNCSTRKSGLLEGTGKAMRHIKVRDLEHLPESGIRALLKAAVRLNTDVGQ